MTAERVEELSPVKRALLEVRELRARLETAERRQREPIAIIGMGLRFPGGANDPASFWRLLSDGIDAITTVPPERWDGDALYDPDPERPGTTTTRFGGFLDQVDRFDARFFGITPREAESMDPQQRLLLEVAWEALEHAGVPCEALYGSRTGVFLGISGNDYQRLLMSDPTSIDAYVTTGTAFSVAAGRLSYLLGLRGPSIAVDTACSSSLVALHLACQSLRGGESNLAIVGGVNAILTPELTINFSKAQMMAPDGRCKTFDAAADGYVRGEGCGVVVLKRLSDALADGDSVLAVIRGTAVNQDGRSGGLTAPNGPSQVAVIREALANAGIEPHAVSYVEAHGTGTALGDPIEVGALVAALGRERSPERPLMLGSLKTNVGHLEAAAGIAGLLKVVLALQHGEIPPHLHLKNLNPHIALDGAPIVIPTHREPWPAGETRRVAGVSSFGISGTNAHVIVEEAPAPPPATAEPECPAHLLTLSAKTETALAELARRFVAALDATGVDAPLADICFTAGAGRSHFAHRLGVVGTSRDQLRKRLAAFVACGEAPGLVRGRAPAAEPPKIAFLFTGQGARYAGMGRQLYAAEPVFRAAIDRCDEIVRPMLDRSLPSIMFADGSGTPEDDGALNRTEYAQPALFALQYALVELWRSWGIVPAAVAGHSMGEYAAACAAGVLSLEDALTLVVTRGRLAASLPEHGAMAAVFADEARVTAALAPYNGAISLAAVNGPDSTVISGAAGAVEAAVANLKARGIEVRRLQISQAFHSPLVEPILDAFEQAAANVEYRPARIPLVSAVTGAQVSDAEVGSGWYWRQHLREPVRFAAAMESLRAAGHEIFVEIGPHPVLLGMARRSLPEDFGTWLPSLQRQRGDREQMLESLAALYTLGAEIDWTTVSGAGVRRKVALPTYPWEHVRYWTERTRTSWRHADTTPTDSWAATTAAARRQAEQGPLDLGNWLRPEPWDALDRLALAYIIRAFRTLGVFGQPGEAWSVAQLSQHFGIRDTYRALLARWLQHLVAEGLLQTDGETFGCAQPLPCPDLVPLEREAAQALVGAAPLAEYAWRCGGKLVSVLTGQESPLETLFPDGSYETVDFLYHDWSVARYFNGIVAAVAEAAVRARPAGRAVRVLEIGAGTGGTAATVLPLLPNEGVSYEFTDVSEFFLTRAQSRFVDYPFVRYSLLDIERDPATQGYTPNSYDVVVAANVLHATRDIERTLAHARELLAPGGLLLLYEATSHPRWMDVTTALIEGWQVHDDEWRRDNPLLDTARWDAVLRVCGYEDVLSVPGAGAPTALLGQHVVLARAPAAPGASEVSTLGPDRRSEGGERDRNGLHPSGATAPCDGLLQRLEQALPDERRELLVDFVRGEVASVLRLDAATPLDDDGRLMDLGIDSLMAVELRGRLRGGLGLQQTLPATLVFDYPTIEAIAGYLLHLIDPAAESARTDRTGTAPATTDGGSSPLGADGIAALSDAEVETLLLQKLGRI